MSEPNKSDLGQCHYCGVPVTGYPPVCDGCRSKMGFDQPAWNRDKEAQMLGFPAIIAWPVGCLLAAVFVGSELSITAWIGLAIGWWLSPYPSVFLGHHLVAWIEGRVSEQALTRAVITLVLALPFLLAILATFLLRAVLPKGSPFGIG